MEYPLPVYIWSRSSLKPGPVTDMLTALPPLEVQFTLNVLLRDATSMSMLAVTDETGVERSQ